MQENMSSFKILPGKTTGKKLLGNLGIYEKTMLESIVNK